MPRRRRIKKTIAKTKRTLDTTVRLLTARELEEHEQDVWADFTEAANRYYNPDSVEGDIMELY